MFQRCVFMLILAALLLSPLRADDKKGFSVERKRGAHTTVRMDGKIIARYMTAHDTSTKETLHNTYKPYLHVFDAEGKAPITKGPGGQFTHHRGIFIGWSRIGFKGKRYDRWHMKGGEIVHKEFKKLESTGNSATLTSVTLWNDNNGKPILDEHRTMVFRRAPEPGRMIIDFTSTLIAPYGEVELNGDPEHAGIQYRPANEVDKKKTVYIFPKENADPKKDLDYPWVGETYTLNGKRYSVVHINHPDNPKKTRYSAYRDYGRFGAFFVTTIPKGKSLTVKYRFVIADGEMLPKPLIEKIRKDFSGKQ